jgi:hypothetical protein
LDWRINMAISYDFTGLADVNPYVNADFTYLNANNARIAGGALKGAVANNTAALRYTATTVTDDIIRVEFTTSFASSTGANARVRLGVLDANYNGYWASLAGQFFYLRRIDNGAEIFKINLSGLSYSSGQMFAIEYQKSTGRFEVFQATTSLSSFIDATYDAAALSPAVAFAGSDVGPGIRSLDSSITTVVLPDYTQRKGSTFDATHTLGTITTATLYGAAITINSTGAGTVNLTDTSGITTSGVYNLVLGDGAATQTQTVQVNVFGVVPSNNPAQKDGVALASLTNVQVRITSGTGLNGVQRFYSPTETTDASGNFSTLDLSSSVAADADPVLMHVLTAAGDSIISSETVGLL